MNFFDIGSAQYFNVAEKQVWVALSKNQSEDTLKALLKLIDKERFSVDKIYYLFLELCYFYECQGILTYVKGPILMSKSFAIIVVFLFLLLYGINDLFQGKTEIYDYIWIIVVLFVIKYNLYNLYSSNKKK